MRTILLSGNHFIKDEQENITNIVSTVTRGIMVELTRKTDRETKA